LTIKKWLKVGKHNALRGIAREKKKHSESESESERGRKLEGEREATATAMALAIKASTRIPRINWISLPAVVTCGVGAGN
jgi:hypothetical protein